MFMKCGCRPWAGLEAYWLAASGDIYMGVPACTLTDDGYIGMFKNTKHWENAKRLAVKSMGDYISGKGKLTVVLSDANAKQDVVEVEDKIKKIYCPKTMMKVKIGIVVGAHVGTGIGITFYEE